MQLEPLKVNSDSRGSFVEAYHLPNDGQISYITILPNEMRGSHYHLRKTEHFLVVWGSAEVEVKNRDTNDVMIAQVNGSKPMDIEVIPNHTHSLTATSEGAIVFVWASERFNEKDTDTYPEEL